MKTLFRLPLLGTLAVLLLICASANAKATTNRKIASQNESGCGMNDTSSSVMILAINNAFKTGSLSRISDLLKNSPPSIVTTVMDTGELPLTYAAKLSTQVTDFLIQNSAKINEADSKNETALVASVKCGATGVTKDLLGRGANPDVSLNSVPLIHWAVDKGDENLTQLLVDAKANLEVKDASGKTPLVLAVLSANKVITTMLLKAGANANHSVDGHSLLRTTKDFMILFALANHGAVDEEATDFFLDTSYAYPNRRAESATGKELLYSLDKNAWNVFFGAKVLKAVDKRMFIYAASTLDDYRQSELGTYELKSLLELNPSAISGIELLLITNHDLSWYQYRESAQRAFSTLNDLLKQSGKLKAEDFFTASESCQRDKGQPGIYPILCILDGYPWNAEWKLKFLTEKYGINLSQQDTSNGSLIRYAINNKFLIPAVAMKNAGAKFDNQLIFAPELYQVIQYREGGSTPFETILSWIPDVKVANADGETPFMLAFKYSNFSVIDSIKSHPTFDYAFENKMLNAKGSSIMAYLTYTQHKEEVVYSDRKGQDRSGKYKLQFELKPDWNNHTYRRSIKEESKAAYKTLENVTSNISNACDAKTLKDLQDNYEVAKELLIGKVRDLRRHELRNMFNYWGILDFPDFVNSKVERRYILNFEQKMIELCQKKMKH